MSDDYYSGNIDSIHFSINILTSINNIKLNTLLEENYFIFQSYIFEAISSVYLKLS